MSGMAEAREPAPVNLICGVLAGRREWMDEEKLRLEDAFGPTDMERDTWTFGFTDHY